MASFEQLKSKYDSVLDLIKVSNVRLDHLHQDSATGKLTLQGGAPSEKVINSLWNQIKSVDPNYEDLTAEFSEIGLVFLSTALVLLISALIWLVFIALEPYARRLLPEVLSPGIACSQAVFVTLGSAGTS